MTQERTDIIAVADIHGRDAALEKLLEQLPSGRNSATKVFLGDYFDRGPQSRQVVDRLIDYAQKTPCQFLLGNHDDFLIRALAGDQNAEGMLLLNGGQATLDSYGCQSVDQLNQFLPDGHRDFLSRLRLFWRQGEYFFVHAGIRPGCPLEDQSNRDLLWIREPYLTTDYPAGSDRTVVSGHSIQDSAPVFAPGKILIDGGAAAPDGTLVAVHVSTRQTWRVPIS